MASIGLLHFEAFDFRSGKLGGDWRLATYDRSIPTRRNAHNYGLGWGAFQPVLVVNLGRVGFSVSWVPTYRRADRRVGRELKFSVYRFPKAVA